MCFEKKNYDGEGRIGGMGCERRGSSIECSVVALCVLMRCVE